MSPRSLQIRPGYYTLTEHTASPEVLVMSLKAWNSLSDDEREFFADCCTAIQSFHARKVERSRSPVRVDRQRLPRYHCDRFRRIPFETADAGLYARRNAIGRPPN